MKILNYFRKRRALKSYVRVLPLLLKKRHGKHKHYTEEQVRETITSAGLNLVHIDFALAIYIARDEFKALAKQNKLSSDYDEARQEIANYYFAGNANFTIHDTFDAAKVPLNFLVGDDDADDGLSNLASNPIDDA